MLSKPKHSLLGINLWFLSGALSVGYCRTFIHPAANLELLLSVNTIGPFLLFSLKDEKLFVGLIILINLFIYRYLSSSLILHMFG